MFFSWPNHLNGKNRGSCWLISLTKYILGLSTRCQSSPSSILWSILNQLKWSLILYYLWIKHHTLLRSGTNMLNWIIGAGTKMPWLEHSSLLLSAAKLLAEYGTSFLTFCFIHTYRQMKDIPVVSMLDIQSQDSIWYLILEPFSVLEARVFWHHLNHLLLKVSGCVFALCFF